MSALMVSISGIRGIVGKTLTPKEIIRFTEAYADLIGKGKIVIGSDGRLSGPMVSALVAGTLMAKGIDVIDIGICPTPTVQFTVNKLKCAGGIVVSASHNPNEWNALKLLNSSGQFLSPEEHQTLLKLVNSESIKYVLWNETGKTEKFPDALKIHSESVLNLEYIDKDLIRSRKFRILLDCVNGAGSYILPDLLNQLGCEVIEMNCNKTGVFPRNPEPVPDNLQETMKRVKNSGADFGIVVDPDADRLVLITGTGKPFGEENTITQIVKFILSKERGNVVVNLSTTRAVDDICRKANSQLFRSPVGEANVVKKMKDVNAIIGGEGSGGVIYPKLHYGRDSLAGIALTLQHLAETGLSLDDLKNELPEYFISKLKIDTGSSDPDKIIDQMKSGYKNERLIDDDGLRIDFKDYWVHLRKSNTEPIIRIIVESDSPQKSVDLAEYYKNQILKLMD